MTDLERLIELLKPYMSAEPCEHESGSCELGSCRECRARDIADHLLANGVILPPVKVGDKVYTLYGRNTNEPWINSFSETVGKIGVAVRNICYGWSVYSPEEFGKSVFPTLEEAEAELERLRKKRNTG